MSGTRSTDPPVHASHVKRVAVIDDHPLFRRGILELLAREPDLHVCGEADSETDGLELVRATHPHVILVDLTLREGSGVDLIRRVRELGIDTPIVVISMRDETLFAQRVLRAGAQGFVSKAAPSEQVVAAIRQVLRKELAISPQVAARLVRWAVSVDSKGAGYRTSIEQLSQRELEVFELLGRGVSAAEIARRLQISAKTVQAHRENIKAKLDVPTSHELTRYAVLWTDGGEPSSES